MKEVPLKKHEVRVNNLVLIKREREDGKQDLVPTQIKDGAFIDNKLHLCKGIKITTQFLEHLEFEKREELSGGGINDLLTYYSFNGYSFMEDFRGFWFLTGYSWNNRHFEFFHELQNIYFDLSGEELVEPDLTPVSFNNFRILNDTF